MAKLFRLSLTALSLVAVVPAIAAAQPLLNFDIPACGVAFGAKVPNGYGGFNWNSNAHCINSQDTDIPNSGIGSGYNTVGQGSNVLFDFQAIGPLIMTSPTKFTLNSFTVAPAWNLGLIFTVQSFFNGSSVNLFSTVLTGPSVAQTFNLNWAGIDELRFTGTGGVTDPAVAGYRNPEGVPAFGQQFAIDNIRVNIIPEPSTYALMTVGLLAVGFVRRRKSR